MGRWFKGQRLEEEKGLIKKIQDTMASGFTAMMTQEKLGINARTWAYWQAQAIEIEDALEDGTRSEDELTKSDKVLLRFLQAIRKGKALARETALSGIIKAAEDPKTWAAGAWYLERTNQQEFGKKVHVDLEEMPKIVGYGPQVEEEGDGESEG